MKRVVFSIFNTVFLLTSYVWFTVLIIYWVIKEEQSKTVLGIIADICLALVASTVVQLFLVLNVVLLWSSPLYVRDFIFKLSMRIINYVGKMMKKGPLIEEDINGFYKMLTLTCFSFRNCVAGKFFILNLEEELVEMKHSQDNMVKLVSKMGSKKYG